MPKLRQIKTNFTAGEVDPRLLGRGDLKAYDNGAARLRNVFVHPLGGVQRRWGMRYAAPLPAAARLFGFEFNTEQLYLLALLPDGVLRVYIDGVQQAEVATPFGGDLAGEVYITQSADTLLLTHPAVRPQKVTRTSHTAWAIAPWSWFVDENDVVMQPYYKFADEAVTMQASATSGSVTLTCSADFFVAGHVGERLRLANKEVSVTAVASARQATATVKQTLAGTAAVRDWAEPAFSARRGWPVTTCFHQARLVIGGSRDLPNRLWLSKSADLFNFDLGTGKDDEAIETPILSDQVNAIRGVFSGQHLQVFTSGAEWAVVSEPLTPTKIDIKRQTRIGSPVDRLVMPVSIDGATVFAPRQGDGLRAFSFSDTAQAYETDDLALTAHHLVSGVVDMDFDAANRWLHVLDAAGNLSTLTVYRSEQITAWTRQETAGAVLSVAVVGDATWLVVRRAGAVQLERLDAQLGTDAALTGSKATPARRWTGLEHLEGRLVRVVADGADGGAWPVEGGAIELSYPASEIEVGLSFTHSVAPLPPTLTEAPEEVAGKRWRMISLSLLLHETASLRLDSGGGGRQVPLRRLGGGLLDAPLPRFSGQVDIRGFGWRRDNVVAPWRVEDDTPVAFMLLAATLDLAVNG